MLKKIINYYFSGTGNTELLVNEFSIYLNSKGFNSHILKMENGFIETDEDFTLGLMFPVAIQSTFPIVWDFIHNLPDVKNRDVFMFDTMESFSGGIIGPLKKVLKKKGYNCIGAREFRMSSSLNTNLNKVETGRNKNHKAIDLVKKYADDLILGNTHWGRIPLLSDLMNSISKSPTIWKSLSQNLSLNNDCIKCKVCIKICPVDALTLKNGEIVISHEKCISCIRCAALCPKKAFLYKGKKLLRSVI